MADPLTPAYWAFVDDLPGRSKGELAAIIGAVVAELVVRGTDTETAVRWVAEAAQAGGDGSRAFDRMEP